MSGLNRVTASPLPPIRAVAKSVIKRHNYMTKIPILKKWRPTLKKPSSKEFRNIFEENRNVRKYLSICNLSY